MFRYLVYRSADEAHGWVKWYAPVELLNSIRGAALAHVVPLQLETTVGTALLHKGTELLLGLSGSSG